MNLKKDLNQLVSGLFITAIMKTSSRSGYYTESGSGESYWQM